MSPARAKHLPARILRRLINVLKKAGVNIEPFLTVREGENSAAPANVPDQFRLGFLDAEDLDELVKLEPGSNRDEISRWLQEGVLCFGVRDQSRLIAKMWCDPNEFNFPPNYRKLEDDEVYLFAAYSDPDYRGQGLAPLMRSAGYAALRDKGKSRFYSYTEYFNTPARRFKEKLGARNEKLRLHIGLFGKWSKTMTLRRYN